MTSEPNEPERGAAEENFGVPETETEERAGRRAPSEPDPERAEQAEDQAR